MAVSCCQIPLVCRLGTKGGCESSYAADMTGSDRSMLLTCSPRMSKTALLTLCREAGARMKLAWQSVVIHANTQVLALMAKGLWKRCALEHAHSLKPELKALLSRRTKALKDTDANLSGDHIREGLCGVISIKVGTLALAATGKAFSHTSHRCLTGHSKHARPGVCWVGG